MPKYNKKQWLTLIVIGIADFCNAICVSLQAPFYPQIAESKGCSPTEYGLVFGIFEFVVFLISPVYGANLHKFGCKKVFNLGIYTTGTCAILFGLLDKVDDRVTFVILSFVIRIIEALGNAAFLTASFALIAREFPDTVATTFASLETCFGVGLIAGPTIGGALFQIGGYTLPFAVMGSALFLSAILTAIVLPKQDPGTDREYEGSILKALRIPGVLLAVLSVIGTSLSIGFLQATLEPHLRSFKFTPMLLGIMFVVNGGVYAVTGPGIGWLIDKAGIAPKWMLTIGTVLVAAGFCLIGPIVYLPKSMFTIIPGLVLHGLGMSCQLVGTFTDCLRTCIANGFPNNVETLAMVSGLWTCTFALGAFIGPSASGALYDVADFPAASLLVILYQIVVGIALTIYMFMTRRKRQYIILNEGADSVGDPEKPMTQTSLTESMDKSIGNGISIEKSRPTALNSLIACNSYKSHAFPEYYSEKLAAPYSYTAGYGYGAINRRETNGTVSSSYYNGMT